MWIRERPPLRRDVGVLPLHRGPVPEEARLRRWVRRLAVPRHLFANARNNAWVRDELAAAFEACALSVHLQGHYGNVVALPRLPKGASLTLIAAHFDTVADCPGADDNASGLAVMLECARVLSQIDPRPPVGFVAFNGEEDGLLGSRDFVESGLVAIPHPIQTAHVLEMVGFRGRAARQSSPLPWTPSSFEVPDFIGLLTNGRSNAIADVAVRSVAAPGLRVLAAKTWGPLHQLLPDLGRSDHLPFWEAGAPAALWTDTGNFRNPHYHRSTDTPDTLDYAFMRGVAELLSAVVHPSRRQER